MVYFLNISQSDLKYYEVFHDVRRTFYATYDVIPMNSIVDIRQKSVDKGHSGLLVV